MKLFDELLLIVVRRRLARFKLHDDTAFSDALLQAIGGELARRSALAGDFDRQAFEASVARTKTQLAAAVEFQDLDVESVIHFQ
jgi:hypothetical protein